ncbi:hypothetical protein BC629DRAFT_1591510 [Irpex lacteus]|nr:hypothetical protein BC629DRAFT_1596138 [Irpex lacteus]KAI0801831.1 hypothetical protein BC629DRAFT_1591510 [Irpex lacteus]
MQIVEEACARSDKDDQIEKDSSQAPTEGVRHRTRPSRQEGHESEFMGCRAAATTTPKCQVASRTETGGQEVPASVRSVDIEQVGGGCIEVAAQACGNKGDGVELGIQDMQRTGIEGCGETVRQCIVQVELAEGAVSVSRVRQTAGNGSTQECDTSTSIPQQVVPASLTFHICRHALELGERSVLVHRGTQTETSSWCDAQVQTSAEGITEAFQSPGGVEETERLGGLYEGYAQRNGKGKAFDTKSWVGGGDGTDFDDSVDPMDLDDDEDYMALDDDEDFMDVD